MTKIIIVVSLINPLLCAYLRLIGFGYYRVVFLMLMIVTFTFISNNTYISIPISVISIGISYFLEYVSLFIMSIIFYLLGFRNIYFINELVVCILQFILSFLIMKIKRLKNGLTFFENNSNFGIGLLISGPIIVLFSIHKDFLSYQIKTMIAFGIIISSIGLFLWIRSAFIRHYRKRLKLRAEEYSKIELAEKSKEIEKLTSENTSLSSIIHLDNHIIQTIETELKELNSPEATEKLLTAVNQRNEYANDTLVKSKNLPTTGNTDIDAALADLYIKAASRGIDYNLNADCDINYLINNLISKDDFEFLLRETITNAIVSIENNPDSPGRILIDISQPNDIYELTVMDNGSTKDGINSISEIIEKSNASILTKKFDDNDSFTNSITVRFDGLNNNTQ